MKIIKYYAALEIIRVELLMKTQTDENKSEWQRQRNKVMKFVSLLVHGQYIEN